MGKIKTTIPSKIILINIVLLMLSFFFYPHLSATFTLLLALFTISFSKKIWARLKQNLNAILLFSSFFWVYLFGMIYTENIDKGWLDVLLKFSFLVFPLLFGIMQKDFIAKKQWAFLLHTFILISALSALFSLLHAAYQYFENNDSLAFFYARLSFLIHPSYYALYLNFALAAIICRLLVSEKRLSKALSIIFWFLIPFFILFIILLESKAGLLGLFSVLSLAVLYLAFYKSKKRIGLLLAILSLMTVGLTFTLLPQTINRVNAVVETMDKEEDASRHSATAARIYLWKAALHSFYEKPILGHGTGDVEEELMEQYEIQNNHRAIEMNYNSHNQYLQTMVATGILGLLSLLALLVFPLLFSFRKKILLYFLLAFLMAINLLVESMFERQAGVMFYAFFNGLLFFHFKNEEV